MMALRYIQPAHCRALTGFVRIFQSRAEKQVFGIAGAGERVLGPFSAAESREPERGGGTGIWTRDLEAPLCGTAEMRWELADDHQGWPGDHATMLP